MGLADIVRSGVAVANSLTSSLQVTVTHEPWIDHNDDTGAPVYGVSVARQALVEYTTNQPTDPAIRYAAKVTFLGPLTPNGATGRREPIDPRDKITLPDGVTGPIVDIKGLSDPSTSFPYLYEVTLGR